MISRVYNRGQVLEEFVNGGVIIDNHDDNVVEDDCCLVVLAAENKPLCLFKKGHVYQSLNGVGFDNGHLFLSQMSVGGTIKGTDIDESNVAEYNKSVTFDSFKIVEWIDRDGTIHSIK